MAEEREQIRREADGIASYGADYACGECGDRTWIVSPGPTPDTFRITCGFGHPLEAAPGSEYVVTFGGSG